MKTPRFELIAPGLEVLHNKAAFAERQKFTTIPRDENWGKNIPPVIGGQLKGGTENYHGINPFTEEKLWPAPIATEEDLEEAVKAASLAFQTWQHTSVEERRRRVNDFSDALGAQKDIWVPIISKETGQPVGGEKFNTWKSSIQLIAAV
ncbi:uncharacterized protein N7443_006348 [Penicillium atrosanguineum]|uniref:uncharacterized protein n=1 Tax=Penicillium atrosanguineum TaxID=1132637 RepID=UPI00238484CF|nr:uncharacterized protein N7443_006348 [Penicillium atrosanguineum]KAJ5298228.1 hypothetical protein N7443_006348 [Penicillium atrosanguineum]